MCKYEIEMLDSKSCVQAAHVYRVENGDRFTIGHFVVNTADKIFSGNALLMLVFNAVSMCRGVGSRIQINCGSPETKVAVTAAITAPKGDDCESRLVADHLRYIRSAHAVEIK